MDNLSYNMEKPMPATNRVVTENGAAAVEEWNWANAIREAGGGTE